MSKLKLHANNEVYTIEYKTGNVTIHSDTINEIYAWCDNQAPDMVSFDEQNYRIRIANKNTGIDVKVRPNITSKMISWSNDDADSFTDAEFDKFVEELQSGNTAHINWTRISDRLKKSGLTGVGSKTIHKLLHNINNAKGFENVIDSILQHCNVWLQTRSNTMVSVILDNFDDEQKVNLLITMLNEPKLTQLNSKSIADILLLIITKSDHNLLMLLVNRLSVDHTDILDVTKILDGVQTKLIIDMLVDLLENDKSDAKTLFNVIRWTCLLLDCSNVDLDEGSKESLAEWNQKINRQRALADILKRTNQLNAQVTNHYIKPATYNQSFLVKLE